MPTVATAAVRGDNRMEESLAGDGELKIILICFLYLINISSSSFALVRFYIPLMSAPLRADGTANKRPLPVEDLGLCKHYLL